MKYKLILRIFLVMLYVLGIALASTIAIMIASGYRIDFSNKRLYKVSIVHLVADPQSDLYINGIALSKKTPQALYLVPASYILSARKDGYQSISFIVNLKSGELFEVKDLTLFRTNIIPSISANPNPNLQDLVNESLTNSSSDLFINYEHEIWADDRLVTRLSSRIISASYYSNKSYIVYQTDSYVGVIRKDGYHNQKLFDYQGRGQLHFSFKNHGALLEAKDVQSIVTATIQ